MQTNIITDEMLTNVVGGNSCNLPPVTSKEYKLGMSLYGKHKCPVCGRIFSKGEKSSQKFCIQHATEHVNNGEY